MKRLLIILLLCMAHMSFAATDDMTITPLADTGNDLDLYAVADLFEQSENLEVFEIELNDPETDINHLDLDEDGYTDYIRVIEEQNDQEHLIALQALLFEDTNQDVALIRIEKDTDDEYIMQIEGSRVLYGDNYIVRPSVRSISAWPIIVFISRPAYRPYYSRYHHNHYPHGYKPYRHYHPSKKYKAKRRSYSRSRSTHVKSDGRLNRLKKDERKRDKKIRKSKPSSPPPSRLKKPEKKVKAKKKPSRDNRKAPDTGRLKRPVKKDKNKSNAKKNSDNKEQKKRSTLRR